RVRRLAHQLTVDIEREGAAAPGGRHLMPVTGLPVGDRGADAALPALLVRELEAEEVDVLDDLEAPVAELEEVGVVLVALLPSRLEPERERAAPRRDLADVVDGDLLLERVPGLIAGREREARRRRLRRCELHARSGYRAGRRGAARVSAFGATEG